MEMRDFMKEFVDFCKEKHIDEMSTKSVIDGYTVRVYVEKESREG